MSNSKGKRIGFVGTIIFHIGLLAILFYLGFHTPLPLPEEEGILVNFGNTNQGLGKKDPAPSQSTQAVTAVTKPAPKPQVSQSKPEKSASSANEKILTQDSEEAPSVPSAKEIAKKKAEVEKNKKIKAEQDRLKKIETEKKRLEEIKQQQEAEAERQRLAEIEKLKKEEAERQEKIANINNKAKNVFGQGTSSNSSQGKTFPSGNQGDPNGSPDSDNYSGSGLGNKGVSYDLKGRNSMSIPKPQYNLQESGKVVVEITVDRNGKVVNARPGMPGSTTSNSTLFEAARKAAMKAVFNSDPKAAAFQQGSITYHFQLD
ncbi:cell envelope integrity protein TolA [Labilibaculum euxinus]|uniref:TonB family protein n=1 Tax=Labilibaculum euxinus TaxID=2686357 RepID=A0A7M4D484_9BACT|nr:TonB family protein [Labilibaculum euxinus]MUP37463.1 TonB family protein [Labilibaculum euxinus]MVB06668.1 TonB family protein [Labilibaculum euxinus]